MNVVHTEKQFIKMKKLQVHKSIQYKLRNGGSRIKKKF